MVRAGSYKRNGIFPGLLVIWSGRGNRVGVGVIICINRIKGRSDRVGIVTGAGGHWKRSKKGGGKPRSERSF